MTLVTWTLLYIDLRLFQCNICHFTPVCFELYAKVFFCVIYLVPVLPWKHFRCAFLHLFLDAGHSHSLYPVSRTKEEATVEKRADIMCQLHSQHIQLCYKWAKAAKIVVWIMPFISLWLLFKQISSSLQWQIFLSCLLFWTCSTTVMNSTILKPITVSWAFLLSLSRSLWNRAVGVSTTDDLDSFLAFPKTQHANTISFWHYHFFLPGNFVVSVFVFFKQRNTYNGVNLYIS